MPGRKRLSTTGLFFLLLTAWLALAAVSIRDGHDWGGDFAHYISHARNIARGADYGDTLYIRNPQDLRAPRTCLPMTPFILAPFYALFGLDLHVFKIVLLAFSFAAQPWFLILWVTWLALSTVYSLPPLRLKERGGIGLVAPALAQQAFPVFVIFAAFGRLRELDVWAWAAYALSKGLSLILLHQRRDLIGDRMTQTQTFAAVVCRGSGVYYRQHQEYIRS